MKETTQSTISRKMILSLLFSLLCVKKMFSLNLLSRLPGKKLKEEGDVAQ
jgi:hypothetical protein